jgi:hypothetical protein
MEYKYINYAKKVYKKKNGLWFDKFGLILSEKEIKDSVDEIERILNEIKEQ